MFKSLYPLSVQSRHKNLCVGCAKLLQPYQHSPEAKLNINTVVEALGIGGSHHFNLLFEKFQEKNEFFFSSGQCYQLAKKRIKSMVSRRGNTIRLEIDELVELMKLAYGMCALTGMIGVWDIDGDPALRPLLLTIDHKIPVSKGGSWTIENLQIMPNCLNEVKGNNDDNELIRWFLTYLSAFVHENPC